MQTNCHHTNQGKIYSFTTDFTEGSFERTFVNKLSSIVANVRNSSSSEVDIFRFNYLLDQVSCKSPFNKVSNNPVTRSRLSIEKTLGCNTHCSTINSSTSWDLPDTRRFLERARRIVHRILGDFSFDAYSNSAFSSGASTSNPTGLCSSFYKYASLQYGGVEVTPRAYSRLLALIENTPTMKRSLLKAAFNGIDPIKIVSGDKFKTVPKNSRIDRTILIQPNGNNILQKAIGTTIRNKLKVVGVDLRDQSINQELARVGSLRCSHATIDLSSASDTLNARIVWELLPNDWYSELESLRCSTGTNPETGETVSWSMFSAMGNAFTFELESLIFYAVSKAACDELGSYVGRINVFGDDIIVPNSCATNVCERLSLCGFIINTDKTYITGRFRESCGAHWYAGICVKPFYIRTGLTTIEQIIRLANQLRKWSSDDSVCDPRLYKLWEYVASFVPKRLHGGFDLESSLSLVSYSRRKVRECLSIVTSCYTVEGEAILAATMQNWSLSHDSDYPGWYRDISEKETIGDQLSKTNESRYNIVELDYSNNTSPPIWVILLPNKVVMA